MSARSTDQRRCHEIDSRQERQERQEQARIACQIDVARQAQQRIEGRVEERSSHASHGKSSERAGAKSNERGAHGGSGTREHAKHSPIGIQKALKGASYPARKEDLLETAQANGADDSTLQTLRDMADDEYDTPAAVSKAIGHEM